MGNDGNRKPRHDLDTPGSGSPALAMVRALSPRLADAIERVDGGRPRYARAVRRALAGGEVLAAEIARVDAQCEAATAVFLAWTRDPSREEEAITAHLRAVDVMERFVRTWERDRCEPR